MIKLDRVNKYFNRFKKNQIHVINDTSIDFSKSGLIALLGPSGCGKTTILNTIGGLDKVNSGNIFVDGKRITRKSSYKVDEIRNLNIGYIFQDYKLVESMTVFENVALALKIIGIKNEEEIEKRVLYTLEKVKMVRYKNRPVSMLSGGERQRVGIARALVKNPKIILADEPTGNLDSKNSLEIMNIIKSISSKYLVILVTHEEELARFYADRIIELVDGKVIKDYKNDFAGALNYEIENRIYLKDYKDIKKIENDNININIYRNNNEDLDINVVFKNGNIYIETKNEHKIEVVENNSNIELIDDYYKEIKNIDIKENAFDIENVSDNNFKPKYSSIFKLCSFISYGFKKILDYPILKKILLGGFFLSGMFIFYSVSSIFATLNIEDKDFITVNKDYLRVIAKNVSVDDYLVYENSDNIDLILPGNSLINFRFNYKKYLQTQNNYGTLKASLSDINSIKENDIIMGRMPNNEYELVIDKLVLEKFIESNSTKNAGYATIEDYLNQEIILNNMNPFIITGITNLEEPNIYASKSMFINMLANTYNEDDYYYYDTDIESRNYIDYSLLLNKEIKLVKGKLPINDYEVIVNVENELFSPINKMIDNKINNHKLKVVGYYENINGSNRNDYLVSENTIKYNLIVNSSNLTIFSNDENDTINYFQNNKMNIYNAYEYDKDEYLENKQDSMLGTLILSGVILGISLIEILLMIRSSFLSRIKEVGIYRAIGVKKSDIYKMFSGEIFAITILASLTGISFMAYILNAITKVPYIGDMYMVNAITFISSILFVLVFNLIVGLLPVFNTIRKTPAQILARFDVD